MEAVPGPQYFPKEKPIYNRSPDPTFGYRRGSKLKNDISSPPNVGPGRYIPEYCSLTSEKKNNPKWTLAKAGRTISMNELPKN